jgi:hypothetical protein
MRKAPILAIIVILAFSSGLAAETKEIKFITYDMENYPHVIGYSRLINKEKPGIFYEFLKVLEKNVGVRMSLTRLPYEELMEMLKTGNTKGYDAYIAASYTPDRDKIAVYPVADGMPDYSKSLYIERYYLYKNKKSPVKWNGVYLTDIKNGIGSATDEAIDEELKWLGYRYKEEMVDVLLKDVAAGKLDVALSIEKGTDYYLKNHPEIAKNVVKLKPEFTARPFFIILSNNFVEKNPELTKKIWIAIGLLRGEYSKIEEKSYSKIK